MSEPTINCTCGETVPVRGYMDDGAFEIETFCQCGRQSYERIGADERRPGMTNDEREERHNRSTPRQDGGDS